MSNKLNNAIATSFLIEWEMHKRIKLLIAQSGMSMADAIRSALEDYLKKHENKNGK